MRRIAGPVALLLVAGGLLVGCSASSDSAGSSGQSRADAPAVSVGDAVGGQVAGEQAAVDRQVVTTGSVRLVVGDPAVAAQRAVEIVEQAGGRVDERTEAAASDERDASARLVLRIPSAELTATLADLKALGDVDQVQLSSTDVTGVAQDLDARIAALKVSVARLETLMASATSSDDLLALESALSSRQGDLEAKQAERAGLAGQVALATVTLDLVPEATVQAGGPSGFWSAIGTGWAALVTTLRGVLIAVGVLVPWIAFAAVVGAVTMGAIRFVRRRRAPTAVPVSAPAE
jgi:hypothetical protein